MDYLSLSLTMIFVLIALFLSKSFKAGVEKDMIIATIRAAVQLLIIGYVLSLIFRGDHPVFILLMVLLMLAVAAQNVIKRKKNTIGSFWRVFAALAIVEIVTQEFCCLFISFRLQHDMSFRSAGWSSETRWCFRVCF